jgi:hypothetical protein
MINTASGVADAWCHPDYASATWDHNRDPATPAVPRPAAAADVTPAVGTPSRGRRP